MEDPNKSDPEELIEAVYPTKLTEWGYPVYDMEGPVYGCYRSFVPSDGEETPE